MLGATAARCAQRCGHKGITPRSFASGSALGTVTGPSLPCISSVALRLGSGLARRGTRCPGRPAGSWRQLYAHIMWLPTLRCHCPAQLLCALRPSSQPALAALYGWVPGHVGWCSHLTLGRCRHTMGGSRQAGAHAAQVTHHKKRLVVRGRRSAPLSRSCLCDLDPCPVILRSACLMEHHAAVVPCVAVKVAGQLQLALGSKSSPYCMLGFPTMMHSKRMPAVGWRRCALCQEERRCTQVLS